MPKKKGKKGRGDDDWDDEFASTAPDEGGEPKAEPADEPAVKGKKGKKKGKKGRGDDSDDDEPPAKPTAAADEDDEPVQSNTQKKKDKKKNKKKGKFDMDDDDDDFDPLKQAAPPPDSDEEDEAPAVKPKSKKKSAPASAFALLGGDDDDDEEEEEEEEGGAPTSAFAALGIDDDGGEEEEEEPLKEKKGKKGKAADDFDAEFAVDDEDDDNAAAKKDKKKDKKGGKKGGKGAPSVPVVVGEITGLQKHPKADNLQVCFVDNGSGLGIKVVTNAPNARKGLRVPLAGVGCTTPGSGVKVDKAKVRGADSFGMLCSAADLGWTSEADGRVVELPGGMEIGEEVPGEPVEGAVWGAADAAGGDEDDAEEEDEEEEAPPPPPPPKEKKDKKKKKGGADLEAMLMAEAGMDAAPPAPEAAGEEVGEEKKEKKKKKKGGADLEAMLMEQAGMDAAPPAPEAAGEEVGEEKKEKKKKKKGGADLEAMLMEQAGIEAPAAPEGGDEKKDKKDKKKKKGGADLDAMLMEQAGIAAPPEPAPPAKEAKPAKKTKEEEEVEALMASLDAPKQDEGGGGKKKKKKGKKDKADDGEDIDALLAELGGAPPPPAATEEATKPDEAAAPPAKAKDDDSDDEEEGEVDLSKMSAAERKKYKEKMKKKQKKKEAKEKAAAGEAPEEDEAKPAKGAKGGKKPSAAVLKMQQEIAERKAIEDAIRAEEEARLKAEKEEEERLAEEERKKEEAKRLKKEKEKAKKEELRKQGKLLTGKAKQEAQRLAAMREQLLKQAGVESTEELVEESRPKKVVYDTKKKKNKKDEEEAAKKKAEEEERRKKAEEEERRKEEEEAAARKKAEEEAAAGGAGAGAGSGGEESDDDGGWDDKDWDAIDESEIKLPKKKGAGGGGEEEEGGGEDESEGGGSSTAASTPRTPAGGGAGTPKAGGGKGAAAAGGGGKGAKAKTKAELAREEAARRKEENLAKLKAKQASKKAQEEEREESSSESGSEPGSDSGSGSGSDSDSDSGSEDESSSEYSSSEYSDSDESEDEEARALAEKKAEYRAARLKRVEKAMAERDPEVLRSPIVCILGHVDTGKTKLLDKIRNTNVQDGEAGGITQQIGATFIPHDALESRTASLRDSKISVGGQNECDLTELKLPGLLVIDTPGHESFTNLRTRGSGLCDVAILVVDIMHGLEQQTIESLNLLKMRKTPFIIALNKIDRLYDWQPQANMPTRDSLDAQKHHVQVEFQDRLDKAVLAFAEQGMNAALYWDNPDPRSYISIVPTSAITGEGLPDMLGNLVHMTQARMKQRLMWSSALSCTVLEVKAIEGLGTTIDVVVIGGTLKEGDEIVVCGLHGPIKTAIRALLTPHPMKEMRVKGSYIHHKEIAIAQGVKICAPGLETAIAGTQLYTVGPDDFDEELKDEVMKDMSGILKSVDPSGEGVCVQASTLGSLEALLEFLKSPAVRIPVSGINIGPISKRDVMRASVMIERKIPEFACILAFDIEASKDAENMARELGVRIMSADIIYHLFDQFTAYMKEVKEQKRKDKELEAVFPSRLKILPTCIFNKKDPIVLGCEVAEGILKVGTPICIPSQDFIDIGRVASLEVNHKNVEYAYKNDACAVKIVGTNATETSRLYGRHFDHNDELVSRISRNSIDQLKAHFREDLKKEDWQLVVKLKKLFQVD